jgi:hypothetical protein
LRSTKAEKYHIYTSPVIEVVANAISSIHQNSYKTLVIMNRILFNTLSALVAISSFNSPAAESLNQKRLILWRPKES